MGYWLKMPKFCNSSKKLHMQGYKVGHSASLPTHVAMKYGGSNMADNHKSEAFWNFSHKLWAIYRRCQNSVTAVWNYICMATYWAILPIWAAMLQWKMADPTWPTWRLCCILAMFGARLAATTTQPILNHQFLFMCMSILWFHWQMSGNFLLWEVTWAQKLFFPLILVFVNCHSDIKMAISLEWHIIRF